MLFRSVKGYLDGIDVADITRFEDQLLGKVRASAPDILESIKTESELTAETEQKLHALLDEFVKAFA